MHLRRLIPAGLICVPALAADRLTKHWAEAASSDPGGGVPGLFRWHFVRNTGMAFSMLSGSTALLAALCALLLAVLLCWLLLAPRMSRAGVAGIGLLLAGGMGNLWDRCTHGAVIDFIELTFLRFAVFNVADICVCVGAGLCAIALLLPGSSPRAEVPKP